MAPSTPPPPSRLFFAALTIASTRSRVISPWIISTFVISHRRQALFFPVPQSAEMDLLKACLQVRFSSARRAPAASSIEDDLGILREIPHLLFDLAYRN